jgi:hypothetical protein
MLFWQNEAKNFNVYQRHEASGRASYPPAMTTAAFAARMTVAARDRSDHAPRP